MRIIHQCDSVCANAAKIRLFFNGDWNLVTPTQAADAAHGWRIKLCKRWHCCSKQIVVVVVAHTTAAARTIHERKIASGISLILAIPQCFVLRLNELQTILTVLRLLLLLKLME